MCCVTRKDLFTKGSIYSQKIYHHDYPYKRIVNKNYMIISIWLINDKITSQIEGRNLPKFDKAYSLKQKPKKKSTLKGAGKSSVVEQLPSINNVLGFFQSFWAPSRNLNISMIFNVINIECSTLRLGTWQRRCSGTSIIP